MNSLPCGKLLRRSALLLGVGTPLVACTPLTREEAREAVDEAELYSQAITLIGTNLDLSEHFTVGDAVDAATENLRDFYASQLPCAEVAIASGTLIVEFGVNGDGCTHQDMTFTGTHEISLSRNEDEDVVVDHVWTSLDNGTIEVSGTAQVTWSGADDPKRRVQHDLTWTRTADGRTATGTGDRTQRPLDGDLAVGLEVSGSASWEGESGRWDLQIEKVGLRWADPIPQSGSYQLDTPFDAELELSFTRSAPNTIVVMAQSGARSWEFDVFTLR